MIEALTALFLFQLVGEVLARGLSLPIPGPVLGMLLLFGMLLARGSIQDNLRETAQTILKHLSLLFVPAGVGIMKHYALLQASWVPIVVTLIASTLITIAVTAATACFIMRRAGMVQSHQHERNV